MNGVREDLEAAALEELERAVTLGWAALSRHTPWGDTYDGFTPQGREVSFERTYLWEDAAGGDIRIEVTVFEPQAYEDGARVARTIARIARA